MTTSSRWKLPASAGLLCALLATPAVAQEGTGTVRIPLAEYQALTQGGAASGQQAGRAAFSQVQVTVTVVESDDGSAAATVQTSARVRVLNDEGWTLVTLPPGGAAITSATVDRRPADLIAVAGGQAWPSESAGTFQLEWSYTVDARRFGDGRVVSVATVPASAQLTGTVPGTDRGVTVVPGSSISSSETGGQTRVTATIPPGTGFSLAWRASDAAGYTLSRASYSGTLLEDTVRFEAELTVELLGQGPVTVPLFPSTVALEDVRVDRQEAPIAVAGANFAVPLRGRGRHHVSAIFEVPVSRGQGLPHIELSISPTPVSRFSMHLPGEREITVEPRAGVRTAREGDGTVATFHVPMTANLSISWAEAVPEDAAEAEVEVRAHADIVHVVRPDEGVLTLRAFGTWRITRGALSRVELAVPPEVQVNAVEASTGVVSDWRVTGEGDDRVLTVFLDRGVEGQLGLDVRYERPWPVSTRTTEPFDVPLLRARAVHRQRGMVALLSNREITLSPRDQEHVTQVGDNALPANVRNELEGTVAHTFRYLDEPPQLSAVGAARQHEAARFDAQVDTLVSLGEVSTSVVVLIGVEVKSGGLDRLSIRLPPGLNVLEVSAPSLRQHEVTGEGEERQLTLELTQPMEGAFPVEVLCERITAQDDELDAPLEVPLISVTGAEVERGRLAVEALAAFQVDPATAERLSPITPSELPEALVMRTTNPILHAYRYAQASPPPRFAVRITRHEVIQTPNAAVDEALYRTLYTRDGVAVTTARFTVRNQREQFLRVTLPAGSQVWSASVTGRSQTPAREGEEDEDAETTVLINIVSADEAFIVELVYATQVPPLGSFGRLTGQLPRLNLVVTRTRWEVQLPEGPAYMDPESTVTLVSRGPASGAVGWATPSAGVGAAPMQVDVPSDGVRLVFEKMYAGNTDDEVVEFSIPYASGLAGPAAQLASALGALMLWLGLLGFAVIRLGFPVPGPLSERIPLASYRENAEGRSPAQKKSARRLTITLLAVSAFGLVLLLLTVGYLSTRLFPSVAVTLVVLLAAFGMLVKRRLDQRLAATPEPRPRPRPPVDQTPPSGPAPPPPSGDTVWTPPPPVQPSAAPAEVPTVAEAVPIPTADDAGEDESYDPADDDGEDESYDPAEDDLDDEGDEDDDDA